MEDEYEDVNIDGNNSELQVYTELQTSNMDTVQVHDREAERCSIKKNSESIDIIQGRIRCVTIVLCVLGVLGLVMVTAIATAALVLTLSSSSTPNTSTCQCQQEIQDLRHEIAANSRKITNLNATFMKRIANNSEKATKNGERIATIVERVATFGNETTANGDRIASINTSLAHIQNFGDCNMTIEAMCTVMAAIGICATRSVQYQRPGETVLDFICLQIEDAARLSPLIATAKLVNDQMKCICHLSNRFEAPANVVCGLQVTRCRVMN